MTKAIKHLDTAIKLLLVMLISVVALFMTTIKACAAEAKQRLRIQCTTDTSIGFTTERLQIVKDIATGREFVVVIVSNYNGVSTSITPLKGN